MTTAIEIVQHYLRALVDIPVVSRVPMNRPPEFVRVTQGPPRRYTPITDRTLVIIQVYGDDRGAVVDTASRLREAMFDIAAANTIVLGWEEEAGPTDFPDPDLDIHRWQFTGQLFQALP